MTEIELFHNSKNCSFAGALDFETAETHVIVMSVSDGTNSINLVINVVVTDINDGPPTFSNLAGSVTIAETVSVGTSVFDVAASDPDGTVSDFGNVQYAIQSGTVSLDL